MKYVPSMYIGQLSGSQGSTTASHNRFGSYTRNRTMPVNTNTIRQQTQRNSFALATRAWRELTAAQRAAYNTAAASTTLTDSLGQAYSPTGAQLYVSQTRNQFIYDPTEPPPQTPPNGPLPAPPETINVSADSATNTVTVAFTPTPVDGTKKLLIEATGPLSNGVSFIKPSWFRIITVSTEIQASPILLTANYTSVFGNLLMGSQIAVRVTAIDAFGQRSSSLVQLAGVS